MTDQGRRVGDQPRAIHDPGRLFRLARMEWEELVRANERRTKRHLDPIATRMFWPEGQTGRIYVVTSEGRVYRQCEPGQTLFVVK